MKAHVCEVCNYVYEGDIPFEELPEDWYCPNCGSDKDCFDLKDIDEQE